jgi:S-adenosyl-L-methionine hydrolase (adenosine-forming)
VTAPAIIASGVITLLTDFGLSDPFVGVMTGAIISRFPAARVIDLCHGIEAQAITQAAFWLERCFPWFPPGTVHVAVVDPGVGSERRILAAALLGHYFLVPDNGLLAERLLQSRDARVYAVDLPRLGLPPASATFHGRDVFAPLAAALASGAQSLERLGTPAQARPCQLAAPVARDGRVMGEVVSVDRFGNLITNLDAEWLPRAIHVNLAGLQVPLGRTYSDALPGHLLALLNSFGVIEVAEREGSAQRRLGLSRGAPVELVLDAPTAATAPTDARS